MRSRGLFLVHIIFYRCGCDECVKSSQDDSLRHSQARINAYRALTSPSLIALSSADPLLTAFQLSWEVGRMSRMETEFRVEYKVSIFFYGQFIFWLGDDIVVLQVPTNYSLGIFSSTASRSRTREQIKKKFSFSRCWYFFSYVMSGFFLILGSTPTMSRIRNITTGPYKNVEWVRNNAKLQSLGLGLLGAWRTANPRKT